MITLKSVHEPSFSGDPKVSQLNNLKKASSLKDLAKILGYPPKSLSYIIYKIPTSEKYSEFQIPKKSGGSRTIQAPNIKLKLLQRKLANTLYACVKEIYGDSESKFSLSHGFKKKHSILTNANKHKNKRYVLNSDLADFFPTINFGRVRGLFIKNNKFGFHPDIATLIAQIACHDNQLPQGSPCSPIISDLVARILDVRIAKLAKKHNCTYSRYVDDLSFSTNTTSFPSALAKEDSDKKGLWVIGEELQDIINRSGFKINPAKTRVQYNESRQMVTGLVVNKVVNVKRHYYKFARSMCYSLFQTGEFYIPSNNDFLSWAKEKPSINQLNGILNFIYDVREYRYIGNNPRKKSADSYSTDMAESSKIKTSGIVDLYGKFLFFINFHSIDKPLIFCEGKTDNIYLKCAIRSLSKDYKTLASNTDSNICYKVKFLKHGRNIHKVLDVAPGVGGINYLIASYARRMKNYKCSGKNHPVIMLIDNDEESKKTNSLIYQLTGKVEEIKGDKPFYYIVDNLYVVHVPKINNKPTIIENCFEEQTLSTLVDGKKIRFDNKKSSDSNSYSKSIFAERVVQPNQKSINFEGFRNVLNNIVAAINHYNASTKDKYIPQSLDSIKTVSKTTPTQ